MDHQTLFGTQTQLALDNFKLQGGAMPAAFIRALAMIKACAAEVNLELGEIDGQIGAAIAQQAHLVAAGAYLDQFPVDRYQTGSGTSTNMNMNEVLANLASAAANLQIHPNDHVNRCQSSNDVIPASIQFAAVVAVTDRLLPAIEALALAIDKQALAHTDVIKTGRTHLMDAIPISIGQEFGAWVFQLREQQERLSNCLPRLSQLPLGGTAIGTGLNSHPNFGAGVAQRLSTLTGCNFSICANRFARIAAQEVTLELSALLQNLAVTLLKICNDLRWMNSGPNAGLAEIRLPALQAGSSIMPGKVNPVIPEAVAMAATQVCGFHTANSMAAASGNFQLNVMLPLIGCNLLDGAQLLAASCEALAIKVFADLEVNRDDLSSRAGRNPILITALNNRIGYQRAAIIVKRAYDENRPLLDVALEETDIAEADLRALLDPARMV